MSVTTCVLMLLLSAADGDLAAVLLPGESRGSALQYQDFRKYASAGRWDDALIEYQGLLGKPFDLTPLTPTHSLQARWLAHRDLGLFPEELRQRLLEPRQAAGRQALSQALARIDEPALRRVVVEFHGAPAAQQAADALGDLAFERGDFDSAGLWYRPASPRSQAKALFARLFAHKRLGPLAPLPPSLQHDLEAFQRDHASAAGQLAGREGKYADILAAVRKDRNLEAPPGDGWPTFGGSAARQWALPVEEHLTDRLSVATRRPLLRLSLESRRPAADFVLPLAEPDPRTRAVGMTVFPALAQGRLFFATPRHLTEVDLATGECRDLFDAASLLPGLAREAAFPPADLYRSTVTVVGSDTSRGQFVLARLGAHAIPEAGANANPGDSLIVCLRIGPGDVVKPQWTVTSAAFKGTRSEGARFEGTPLVHQDRAYVAVTRPQGDRTMTAIHCYPLESSGTAQPLWVRDVCETPSPAGSKARSLHHLLTLAGPNVVYCSHSGAIVALDALSGQRVWGRRYRSAVRVNRHALPGAEGRPPIQDLAPPMFADGRLFVAPADSETLFCLDPRTGTAYWEREGLQVVHLLGTYQDRVLVTTADRLRAIDAVTGSDRSGWMLPDVGRLPPVGRGQLVGDVVLWPTARGVLLVDAATGQLADGPARLHRVPVGNLLYHDGLLIVADQSGITFFHAPARPEKAEAPEDRERTGQGLGGRARWETLQRAAILWERAGDPVRAARLWTDLLGEGEQAPTTLLDERHRPWPAATLAVTELDRLRRGPRGEVVQVGMDQDTSAANPLTRSARDAAMERAVQLEKAQLPAARTLWRTVLRHGTGSQRAAALRSLERTRPRIRTPDLPLPADSVASRTGSLAGALDFETGERLVSGTDRLITVRTGPKGGSDLRLREGERNGVAWQTKLDFVPGWSRRWEELLLVAGPAGLAGVRLDGECLWQIASSERLDAFRLVGERLFVRVHFTDPERFHLRTVDSFTGAILWEFDPGLALVEDAGLDFVAGESRVFVRSPGRWVLLDAVTGRILREGSAPEDGPDELRLLDDRRGLLVAERRSVELLDLTTGTRIWSWDVPAVTTSRHEPNRLLPVGDAVWVQVPVNIGHELHRLELRTGQPQSALPRLLRAEPFDLSSGRVLGNSVFLLEGTDLVARSTLDAAVRWRQPLPVGPATHRCDLVGDEVLVMPAAVRVEGTEFHCLFGTLEWKMKYPPTAGFGTPTSILRLDATTGNPARLEIPFRSAPRFTWSWRPGLRPYLRPQFTPFRGAEAGEMHLLPTLDGWRLVLGARCWNLK